MAVSNVGGHGVTSVLGQHGGQGAIKSHPKFNDAPQASQSTPSNMSISGTAKPKKVSGPSK